MNQASVAGSPMSIGPRSASTSPWPGWTCTSLAPTQSPMSSTGSSPYSADRSISATMLRFSLDPTSPISLMSTIMNGSRSVSLIEYCSTVQLPATATGWPGNASPAPTCAAAVTSPDIAPTPTTVTATTCHNAPRRPPHLIERSPSAKHARRPNDHNPPTLKRGAARHREDLFSPPEVPIRIATCLDPNQFGPPLHARRSVPGTLLSTAEVNRIGRIRRNDRTERRRLGLRAAQNSSRHVVASATIVSMGQATTRTLGLTQRGNVEVHVHRIWAFGTRSANIAHGYVEVPCRARRRAWSSDWDRRCESVFLDVVRTRGGIPMSKDQQAQHPAVASVTTCRRPPSARTQGQHHRTS